MRKLYLSAFLPQLLFVASTSFTLAQAPATAPVSPERDPAGIALLTQGLEAMGGDAAWRQVRAVQIHGTLSSTDGKVADRFQWADDWSNGYARRRDHVRSGQFASSAVTAESQNTAKPSSNNSSRSSFRPKSDALTSLLPHAPAAAIAIAIQNEKYAVTAPVTSNDGLVCLSISTPGKIVQDGGMFTKLCFSAETYLLKESRLVSPFAADPKSFLIEKLQYENYERRRGLLYPTTVSLVLPGLKRTYSFQDGPDTSAPAAQGVSQ